MKLFIIGLLIFSSTSVLACVPALDNFIREKKGLSLNSKFDEVGGLFRRKASVSVSTVQKYLLLPDHEENIVFQVRVNEKNSEGTIIHDRFIYDLDSNTCEGWVYNLGNRFPIAKVKATATKKDNVILLEATNGSSGGTGEAGGAAREANFLLSL